MAAGTRTSTERAVATLREQILDGTLLPGARLGEVEVSERLGVSRTPVREALGRLAAEGLVEIVPNRGARVATWSAREIEGIFELRALLEPQLTALAAANVTADDLAELDDLAARMRAAGAADDREAIAPLNRRFHDRLVEIADHPALAQALAGAIHRTVVARNLHEYDDASLHRALAHHVEIVAALREADGEWARAVMTAHIRNARAVMLRATTTGQAAPARPHE